MYLINLDKTHWWDMHKAILIFRINHFLMTLLSVISEQHKYVSEKQRMTCIQNPKFWLLSFSVNQSLMIFPILTCVIRDSLPFLTAKCILVKDLLPSICLIELFYITSFCEPGFNICAHLYPSVTATKNFLLVFLIDSACFLQKSACIVFTTFLCFSL